MSDDEQIQKDLIRKDMLDMHAAMARTAKLAPNSKMGISVAAEATMNMAVFMLSALAAMLPDKRESFIINMAETLKQDALKMKRKFESMDMQKIYEMSMEDMPDYWND